jgi:ribosome maturation factor RimP
MGDSRWYEAGRLGGLATGHSALYLEATNHLPHRYGGWPQRAAFFVLDRNRPTQTRAPNRPRHTGLEARLAEIVAPSLEGMGYELVRVAVIGLERPTVQIMADRADGAPVTLDDCEAISHALGAVIDVADPMPGEWVLEVSSPGIDRPLTRPKDWARFVGHLARAELEVPMEGRRRFSGVVLGADEAAARLRLDDGSEVSLPLANIRRAKLVLTDELIAATATDRPTN